MKKSGFTLIELLAVIAILAIILVISIPKILDVIETSKINTLKNAVKLIADSAEKKYTENEAFLEEEEITCDSVSKLNKEDYNKCTIIFDVSITSNIFGIDITNIIANIAITANNSINVNPLFFIYLAPYIYTIYLLYPPPYVCQENVCSF